MIALILLTYLASLILLPALALAFVRKHGTGWRLFFVVAALQCVIAFVVLVPVLTNYPTAGAIILPGVLAGAAALIGIIGLVLYALLFFVVHRPKNWKRNSLLLTSVSGLAVLAWAAPSLISQSGISTNVNLHGVVTDIDGNPVPNAEVHLSNCAYILDPVPVTDVNGRFEVVANCGGYLIIDHIRNPATNTDCQSWFPSSSEHGLMVFSPHTGTLDPVRNPSWLSFPADNPVMIPCVWEVPEAVRHLISGQSAFPVDGRVVTIAPALRGRYLEVMDGRHEGLFHIEFLGDEDEPADPALPAAGLLRITPVSGGIQVTEDHEPFNAAPADGYQPYAELALADADKKVDQSFYFYSDDRRVYGSVRVWMNYSYSFRTRALTLPLQVRLDIYLNDSGSRVLLTHKVAYQ